MSEFEPDGGHDDNPVTPEEYKLVRSGKGTPEQIARVKAALKDRTSPLCEWLGEGRLGAQMAITRLFRTEEESKRAIDAITPIARKNNDRLIEYLCHKRDLGVLTQDEVHAVLRAASVPGLNKLGSEMTPTDYAMCVSRMSRALIKMRPELASEVKALPISPKR
jgi:hypothetical protein